MVNINEEIAKIFNLKEDSCKPSDLSDLLCCPFCGESDFDLIGLKGHLEHMDCEVYNETEVRRRLF